MKQIVNLFVRQTKQDISHLISLIKPLKVYDAIYERPPAAANRGPGTSAASADIKFEKIAQLLEDRDHNIGTQKILQAKENITFILPCFLGYCNSLYEYHKPRPAASFG